MMVNSLGTSRYSAITFTPPSDTSVITQSRGSEPVPNWIFATRLQRRRSLLRRLASMSILCTTQKCFIQHSCQLYRTIVGIGLAEPFGIYAFSLSFLYRSREGALNRPERSSVADGERAPRPTGLTPWSGLLCLATAIS